MVIAMHTRSGTVVILQHRFLFFFRVNEVSHKNKNRQIKTENKNRE